MQSTTRLSATSIRETIFIKNKIAIIFWNGDRIGADTRRRRRPPHLHRPNPPLPPQPLSPHPTITPHPALTTRQNGLFDNDHNVHGVLLFDVGVCLFGAIASVRAARIPAACCSWQALIKILVYVYIVGV